MRAKVWTLCFSIAVAGCGDDDPSDQPSGTGATGNGGNATAGGAAGQGATGGVDAGGSGGGGNAAGMGGSGGSGVGGSVNGLSCTEMGCAGDDMSCDCNGSCALCNAVRCFNWELEVECQSGIAGVTCICKVDGRDAGNCNEAAVVCSLETSCCTQFLTPG
jgi:hypothetical protein